MIQQYQKINKKNKFFIMGFAISIFSFGSMVFAQSLLMELPYGGIRTLTVPCTCHSSPSKALVTVFDFVQMRYLKLAYMPGASLLYMYFDIWSSYYLLGSYNPYVRGTCLVTATGGDCEPLPDDGLMGGLPGTGTSEPGKVPLIP